MLNTGSLGASEATGVTDDDPEVFAVGSVELVVCADTAESASDNAAPAFECFKPLRAPPVPTACPDPAAVRFDGPVVLDAPVDLAVDEPESPLAEPEFEPAADDPVDPSAHATPNPEENNAAPTPRATANPPTRPTNLEAPMTL
ncbi:hypothetical protein H7J51_01340 [Mycobacterium crocinum]|uniref:hypothetical protein n=1 Tax=Mycolicibacterium crocinum TaxID=388459 RepID=UPI0021F356D2|nr:hypothetical protein [Mycolicibacterium crocinum]MCV7213924.1 hypothetical protein [Mycolicibacterium crocinum]